MHIHHGFATTQKKKADSIPCAGMDIDDFASVHPVSGNPLYRRPIHFRLGSNHGIHHGCA